MKRIPLRSLKTVFLSNFQKFTMQEIKFCSVFTYSELKLSYSLSFSIYLAWSSDTFLQYPLLEQYRFLASREKLFAGPIPTRTPVNCVCCVITKTSKNVWRGLRWNEISPQDTSCANQASCEIIAVGNVILNGCSIYTTLLLRKLTESRTTSLEL